MADAENPTHFPEVALAFPSGEFRCRFPQPLPTG